MGLQFRIEILKQVCVVLRITWIILEQVVLVGEGEYNLNALKVIEVTDSYHGLDQSIKG